MTPEEGSSYGTWITIIIIVIILALGGWWYYSRQNVTYRQNTENNANTTGDASNRDFNGTPINPATGSQTGANQNNVNFNTANDLPNGSSFPDIGK